jgi:protein tyrosine phosphatase (PTP) superfamily phosphohydrolase (DUF442 family)
VSRKRVCVFLAFSLMFLCLVGFTQAQMSLANFRWLGETGLALCGQPENAEQWETLKSWGVNATVNLRSESQDDEVFLNSIGIEYYYLPVTNNEIAGLWDLTEQQVEAGIHWINSKLTEGKKVLIHCQLGQNRAPTMAMMWYIHEGHTAEEAYNWVLQYPISNPYLYQTQQADNYYTWLQQQPTSTPPPNPPTPTPTPTPASTPTPATTLTPTATPNPKPTHSPAGEPEQTEQDFPIIPILTGVTIFASVSAGLLVYFKKRKSLFCFFRCFMKL